MHVQLAEDTEDGDPQDADRHPRQLGAAPHGRESSGCSQEDGVPGEEVEGLQHGDHVDDAGQGRQPRDHFGVDLVEKPERGPFASPDRSRTSLTHRESPPPPFFRARSMSVPYRPATVMAKTNWRNRRMACMTHPTKPPFDVEARSLKAMA